MQDVVNPCCVLSNLLVSESTKKQVCEKEQKKNSHRRDRRKNIFVLAAGKKPNDLIFTSVAEKTTVMIAVLLERVAFGFP